MRNHAFVERVAFLKNWYNSYPQQIDSISGNLDGYLDCLVDLHLISQFDVADIQEATIDYITGFKDDLSLYED